MDGRGRLDSRSSTLGQHGEHHPTVRLRWSAFDPPATDQPVQPAGETARGQLQHLGEFDIASFPTMTLVSTSFAENDGEFEMNADLTIKGVTNPVQFTLSFEGVGQDPWGGTRAGFSASATINRRDWGIEWNAALETGGVLVGDRVQIELDLQLVKA